MKGAGSTLRIRPLTELDVSRITAIDERLTGVYDPDAWERRVVYYIRRDPEACPVAELDGRVVGFMLADVRGGEFGLEETCGWIERFGIDPDFQGRSVGRKLFEAAVEQLRARGAVAVRTLVGAEPAGLAEFFRAVGFVDAPLTALEMNLQGPRGRKDGTE
jgi:ribosomal protein S18 acetylase RimI-like enzyme